MKPDILAKLTEELRHEITSERQVVYLLVELRKLMELNGDTEKESPYDTLTLYCDWVAHPLLDPRRAQQIVEQFDKYESFLEEITNVKDGQKVVCDIDFFRDFTETLKLAKFREQFREYLEKHELDSSIGRDDNMWDGFLRYYFGVIEDCPLKCAAKGLKFADEVVIKAVKLPPAGDRLEIAALWIWKSKVTGETHTTPQRF